MRSIQVNENNISIDKNTAKTVLTVVISVIVGIAAGVFIAAAGNLSITSSIFSGSGKYVSFGIIKDLLMLLAGGALFACAAGIIFSFVNARNWMYNVLAAAAGIISAALLFLRSLGIMGIEANYDYVAMSVIIHALYAVTVFGEGMVVKLFMQARKMKAMKASPPAAQ